jgi:RHS repeat-associated protein
VRGSLSTSVPVTIERVALSPPGDFTELHLNEDGSFTRRLKDGTVISFDPQGLQTSTVDRNGNTTRYTYDSAQRLTGIEDPAGLATGFGYQNRLLTEITDPANRVTRFLHDPDGDLVEITDPDGAVRRFEYDQRHLLVRQTTPRGVETADLNDFVTQYEYDFSGRYVRSILPDGSSREMEPDQSIGLVRPPVDCAVAADVGCPARPAFTFTQADIIARYADGNDNETLAGELDALGNAGSTVDPLGRTTTIERDGNGLPTRIVRPNGAVVEVRYDDRGNLTVLREAVGTALERVTRFVYEPVFSQVTLITDPIGAETMVEYDERGNPVLITNALGGTQELTYDARGLPLTVSDENGNLTTFAYDSALNTERVTDALGNATALVRDAAGNVVTLTEAAGSADERSSTFTYDARNRLLAFTDPTNATTRFRYDAAGNLVEDEDPTAILTRRSYDELERLASVEDPLRGLTQFEYDLNGNLVEITDALNRLTAFEYDAGNQLVKTIDPMRGESEFTYDQQGNIVRFEDARGNATTFAYDLLDRATEARNPLGAVSTFRYNARDELVSGIDPKGQTIEQSFDALGRLVEIRPPGDTIRFTYDPVGNLTSAEDTDSRVKLAHDALNRASTVATVDRGAQPAVTLTYGYDAVSNRVSLVDSEGGTTGFEFDAAGQLIGVVPPGLQRIDLAYDPAGRQTEIRFPSGLTSQRSYDARGRLEVVRLLAGFPPLAKGGQGGFAEARETEIPLNPPPSTTLKTGFSKGDSVLRNDIEGRGQPALDQLTYTYDASGNIASIAEPGRTHEFAYDGLNRLIRGGTSAVPETHEYDPVGNRVRSFLSESHVHDAANRLLENDDFLYAYDANGNLTAKTAKQGGVVTTYTYDALNRLVRIEFPDATEANYRYDALGRRIEKNVGGTVTRYVYDGLHILLEYDGSNTLAARYSHGDVIDQPLALQRSGEGFFYHADHLGSIRLLTDAAGSAVNTYRYDSYGRVESVTEGVVNPFTYTARELDPESGLYYYRARYYDPHAGRFISEDPLGLLGGDPNLYSYVLNNAVNATDPFGLVVIVIGGLVVAAGLIFGAALIIREAKRIRREKQLERARERAERIRRREEARELRARLAREARRAMREAEAASRAPCDQASPPAFAQERAADVRREQAAFTAAGYLFAPLGIEELERAAAIVGLQGPDLPEIPSGDDTTMTVLPPPPVPVPAPPDPFADPIDPSGGIQEVP